MGKIIKHPKVKLIIGFIFKDELYFLKSLKILKRYFKAADFQSQYLSFNYTDYYAQEMGSGLKRAFVSFKQLILPEQLSSIKIITNKIEEKLSKGGRRLINIDPGYIDLAKLVLASTKDYKHRIYLAKGIFAEITLVYKGRSFQGWECTYPDYATPDYINIFNKIRDIYYLQVKSAKV
jgi:hypothetical protein